MRFSFVNAVQSTAWVAQPDTGLYSYASDFFEIPHNHMGFYLPGNYNNLLASTSGYKINHCKWEIDNIQFINLTETVTGAPAPLNTAGNFAPTIDIFMNSAVEPNYRQRIWDYDIVGNQRATVDNSSTKIDTICGVAESETMGLPIIQFNASNNAANNYRIDWFRYTRNHTLDSRIGCLPQFFKGWRRICQPSDKFEIIGTGVFAPTQLNIAATQPALIMPSNTGLSSDAKLPNMRWRSNYDGALHIDRHGINPNYFIRCRDPPRPGAGSSSGSSNSSGPQLMMKFVIDITTEMAVEFSMDALTVDTNDLTHTLNNNVIWNSWGSGTEYILPPAADGKVQPIIIPETITP